jgi:predicted metal-dependent hydrolase
MDKNLVIFIIVLICIISVLYFKTAYVDMTYVKSNIDNQYYLVRNESDKQEAANTLAKIRQHILTLSQDMYENRNKKEYLSYKEYIERLYEQAPKIIIVESTKDSKYTSYSVNKGEQIVFCLRKRLLPNNLHDINLMMYVVLHEISHVACPIYDNHGPLFRKIFNFITIYAIKLGIYEKINFREDPVDYCGLLITDSIV